MRCFFWSSCKKPGLTGEVTRARFSIERGPGPPKGAIANVREEWENVHNALVKKFAKPK
jgi:hypothetical protein